MRYAVQVTSRPDHSCVDCRSDGSGWTVASVVSGGGLRYYPHARSGGKLCRICAVREAKRQNAARAVLAHARAASS